MWKLAIGVVVAVGGCSKKAADQPAPSVVEAKVAPQAPPKPITGAELATWYQGCWDAFGAQKWTAFADCYADNIRATTLGMPSISGKQAVLDDHKGWQTAFPDASFEPQLTLVSGRDILAVRWFGGTQTGLLKIPGGEVPGTNKKVSMLLVHHAELGDGERIAREWFALDMGTLMLQLGLSKDPGRAPLDKGWPGAPMLVVAKDDELEHTNAAAVKHIYDLWNKRELKQMSAMIADDAIESFNSEPKDLNKKEVDEENKGFIAAFSDNRVDVDTVWAAGDYTVA